MKTKYASFITKIFFCIKFYPKQKYYIKFLNCKSRYALILYFVISIYLFLYLCKEFWIMTWQVGFKTCTLIFLKWDYFSCTKRNDMLTFSWGSYIAFPLVGHNNKKETSFILQRRSLNFEIILWNYDMAYPDVIDNNCLVI